MNSRSFELGTFDASILPIIWKKQSANWDVLALGYISDIVSIVHGFIRDLLRALCEDERIRQELNDVLLDHLLGRYEKRIEDNKVILSVERVGTPLTSKHYFTDDLGRRRTRGQRSSAPEKRLLGSGPIMEFSEAGCYFELHVQFEHQATGN